MKYGSHISFSKQNNYLVGAGKETLNNKANSMMIYLGGPHSSIRTSVENYNLEHYISEYSKDIPVKNIIVHAPYIVNPASISKGEFAVSFLIEEIERMNYIGAEYLVLHPGAYTDSIKEESINKLIDNLKSIISKTKNVVILLETMSGKGTEIGSNFEELSFIVKSVNSDRIGICLDTCHIWDAGYDLNDYESIIKKLKDLDLLRKIKVIHVNDSKNDLGSKKDRHENIGNGKIGFITIKKFIELPCFDDVFKILETPYVNDKPIYDKEIQMLFHK